jgi:electron transfer flavoprotein beta subunit
MGMAKMRAISQPTKEIEPMNVIVLVKQVLDPGGLTFRRDKERMFVNREDYIVDPGSKAAIEAALRLKDSGQEHSITALTMGKPRADDALREALAMGCDQAYLLTDEAFKDADVTVTTNVLVAAVIKLGGADLIVAGRESGDTGAGQIGPRLAQALDYAQVTDACELVVSGGALQAKRRWGQGYAAVSVSLPAVVSVAPEAFPPRYAPGARIINAYREWEVTTWGVAELDLNEFDLEAILAFRRESFPPPLEVGEVIRGDPHDVAQEAVIALRLQKLVG